MKMNGEQAFTIRFVLVWWHGASTRSEKAVLQGRRAPRNELTGGVCALLVVEQHGAQSRQPCAPWAWRPARGLTGKEGRKPTAERGCKYVISVVCVRLHPNMRGSQPRVVWLLLAAPPASLCHQLESSARVLPGGEASTLGQPGPQWCPMTVPAPPGPVILVSCRFCHQVRKTTSLSEPVCPFQKTGHRIKTMVVLGKGAKAVSFQGGGISHSFANRNDEHSQVSYGQASS